MNRTASVVHFVAVSDLSKPPTAQEGILIEVEGRGGDNPKNRHRAMEIVHQMWEKGEIEGDLFPDGLTEENIIYVPADSPQLPLLQTHKPKPPAKITPIILAATELIELTRLQLEIQDIAEEAEPYLPIIQAVLERNRPLTKEEKELAKDKKYGKTLERLGTAIANQETYRETCPGYAKLILNAITWQLNKGIKEPIPPKTQTRGKTVPKKTTRRKTTTTK